MVVPTFLLDISDSNLDRHSLNSISCPSSSTVRGLLSSNVHTLAK